MSSKGQHGPPIYESADGITITERWKDGRILVIDPAVQAMWIFLSKEAATRIHGALDDWLYPEPK